MSDIHHQNGVTFVMNSHQLAHLPGHAVPDGHAISRLKGVLDVATGIGKVWRRAP